MDEHMQSDLSVAFTNLKAVIRDRR